MSQGLTALRHNAFVHESQDEYVETAVGFLQKGLQAGEGAIVAQTRPRLALVRESLGPDASAVTFVDVSAAYTRPAKTLAAYHRLYAEQLSRTATLRAVADVQCGPNPGEWELWTGYEVVFNRSFAHLPAWVLCTYDGRELSDAVRDGVLQTHPEVVSAGTWVDSADFDDSDRLLVGLTGQPEPIARPASIPVGDDVEHFREHLVRSAAAHGDPGHKVRVSRAGGRFVCEIVDEGPGFDDPSAGYLAPRWGRGAGLWVARRLTWQLDFSESAQGFTARITL